jgi:Zn-dependent M16 (insulinase) family peptidase
MTLRLLLLLIPLMGLTLSLGGCKGDDFDLSAHGEGDSIQGFELLALYENTAGQVMGGRLIDERTGFLVDLLSIQSVPQGFMWVKTLPYSDQGEPHACEHLLLGKGPTGRAVSSLEEMSLGSSSAWTSQLNTVYHFNTLAGDEAFRRTLEARLNALINPDFRDEEIRREVSHVAVAEDPESGELYLEEKGTVFTEMVSSYEGPGYPLWNGIGEMLFGPDHPQSNSSGGLPEAMRDMTPEDLWSFHGEFYRPSGMGIIVSLPAEMPVDAFLGDMAAILARVWPESRGEDHSETVGIMAHDLPAPEPAAGPGELRLLPYISENPASPGRALFAWPANQKMDTERMGRLDLFLDAFAGGAGTPLYDALVASETRVLETGASSAYGHHGDEPGHPIYFSVGGIDPERLDMAALEALRGVILDRLRTVKAWQADDPTLAAFNREAASRLESGRKQYRQALDRPPMFGFRRGSAGYWQRLLGFLERKPGFRKSLVLEDHFAGLSAWLDSEGNPWTELIDELGLLDTLPMGVGVRPSSDALAENRRRGEEFLAGSLESLKKQYGLVDEQAAMAAYRSDFDALTADLEAGAAADPIPEFVADPPLGLDEPLDFEELQFAGGAPLVASTFENMSSATLGLAFRLELVPFDRLHLLPLLPSLLTRAGLELEGEILDHVAAQERRRREITSFAAYFDSNMESGRIELVMRGTAAGADELARLTPWLSASLESPYLAEENLPRLRDLADQALTGLRTRMQGSEESWVQDPAAAHRYQNNPLFLSTSSFLTTAQHWFRIKWLLTDPGEDGKRIDAHLAMLSEVSRGGREAIVAALARTPDGAGELVEEINSSLSSRLPELPDDSLVEDWRWLCASLEADLNTPPAVTLEALSGLLGDLRNRNFLRGFLISSSADREILLPYVNDWVASFETAQLSPVSYPDRRTISERLRQRRGLDADPVYVGLLNENTRNGTIIFTSRNATAWDPDRESVLDALAGNVYSGGGGHGLFMRTWAAGLAYSNGYRYRERNGMASYYAERCPDVAQTLRFVTSVLEEAPVDEALVRYAVAVAFNSSRAAGPYEQRGEEMAANLTDGVSPERVRAFRRQVLALKDESGLSAELHSRFDRVYGQVMVGLGEPLSASQDGNFFLIGPEPQFESLETLIEKAEAPHTVERLYPRDFWLAN